MGDKQSMILYYEWLEDFEEMTDAEVGQLIKAVLEYEINGNDTQFKDRSMRTCFRHMKKQCDMNRDKYEERCKKNSENGKLGGRPKKRTVSEKSEWFFEKAKKADTVTVTDTDNDTDTVCVTDSCDTHTAVFSFFRENNFSSDPAKFIDYNIGRGNEAIFDNPKRWQAVARNWEKQEQNRKPQSADLDAIISGEVNYYDITGNS